MLCVGAGSLAAQFITADGMPLIDVAMQGDSVMSDACMLHNTGLVYEYAGRAQLEGNFAEGLFRPYFEIL